MDRKRQNNLLDAYLKTNIEQAKGILDDITVAKPVDKSVKKTAKESVNKAALDLTRRLAISHSPAHTAPQTINHPISQNTTPIDSQPSAQTDEHPDSHTDYQTVSQSEYQSKSVLSKFQRRALAELMKIPTGYTSYPELEARTGIKFATLRYCMQIFFRRKIISKPIKFRNGMHQGMIISVNQEEAKKYLYSTDYQTFYQSKSQSQYHSNYQPDPIADSLPSNLANPNKEEKDNTLLDLLLSKIPEMFPSLSAIGFETKQLKDVISSWQLLKIPLDHMSESLDRIDWAVSNEKIKAENPLNYIYKSLMRGPFAKPPGYVSRAEAAIKTEMEEANRVVELKKAAFEVKFQAMIADPESDEYKMCYEQLNDFERKRKSGMTFESGMKRAFLEILIEQGGAQNNVEQ